MLDIDYSHYFRKDDQVRLRVIGIEDFILFGLTKKEFIEKQNKIESKIYEI